MPFTLSHPAAAVPLARPLRLPMSALWVGSLSPDLIYFLKLEATGEFGHSFWGLFGFCLPSSLLVLWLWHRVVKQPAVALLPAWAGRRCATAAAEPFAFGPGRRLLLVAAGILAGAVSHDVWDAFTHTDGWVTEHWPLLQQQVPFPYFSSMPICKLLQLISTGVGALLLAWWAWRWLWRQPAAPVAPPLPRRLLWLTGLVLLAVLLGTAWGRWQTAQVLHVSGQVSVALTYYALRWGVVQGLVATCSFLWLLLIGFGLGYRRIQVLR